MSARVIIVLVVLGLGGGAGFLIAGGEDVALPQSTATVDPPDPFKTGMAFSEPPAVRSARKRLRATLIARNSTAQVSGVEVGGTQSYSAKWRDGATKPGFLGPTLRVRPGDTVELTLDNRLKVPEGPKALNCAETRENHEAGHGRQGKPGDPEFTNVHFHGLHVTPRERSPYGDTVLVHLPNGKSRIRFKIRRNHDKGTFWYHAHLHECTDDQVTRGLAGLLLVGDSRKALPRRLRRIKTRSLALKDIQVVPGEGAGTWQIDPAHEFFNPTQRTVNGLVNPRMRIRPGETQLWRLLNASSGIWYQVVLVDESNDDARDRFTVVAQDGNSLRRAKRETTILIPPGARFDVLVRGPASGSRVLKTLPFDQGFAKFPEETLATVEVAGSATTPIRMPDKLSGPKQRFPKERGPTRRFTFDVDLRDTQFHISDQVFNPTINNADFDPDSPDATPILGTTERWLLYNKSAEWHPFHIHQNDFRVVKTGPGGQPQLPGDHDIVALPPGTPVKPSVTEIEMPFTDYPGNFVFHCHILEHEDGGMMSLVELRRRGRER